MNNIKSCSNNYPLPWLNNLYPPHIYDYLKSLSLNTSVSSTITEMNTNQSSNTPKKHFYDIENQYLQNSMNEDQSLLKKYSHEFTNSEFQQVNYPLDKSLPQINNQSRCSTPLPTTTVCLTNLIQNENDVIHSSYSSPYSNTTSTTNNNNNKNSGSQHHPHQLQSSAFSPVSSNNNNNNHLAGNSSQIKSPPVLHKEHQWLNTSLENLQKLNSSISLPFTSNLSTDYFLSLASAMNGVLTQKLNENYLNPCKFQQSEHQVNLKDTPQMTVNTNSLFKQNHDNTGLEHLTTFPLHNKNEVYSSRNYERDNNNNDIGSRKGIIKSNVGHSKMNVFTKCDPDEKSSYTECLELKGLFLWQIYLV
ncbi:unnamed protein product [Trichobilharzia regenti]|nr:unnamed protein product [Trichobilharzia regenti]